MPAPKTKPGDVHYYVLADELGPIAGHTIWEDKDGNKRVTMNPKAAQWWMDQGAIGPEPVDQISEGGQHALKQMHGKGALPKGAPASAPDPNIPGIVTTKPFEPEQTKARKK